MSHALVCVHSFRMLLNFVPSAKSTKYTKINRVRKFLRLQYIESPSQDILLFINFPSCPSSYISTYSTYIFHLSYHVGPKPNHFTVINFGTFSKERPFFLVGNHWLHAAKKSKMAGFSKLSKVFRKLKEPARCGVGCLACKMVEL